MNVKQVAINLISQVDKGAYSNIALNETFKILDINSKEKAFITEIFYGVIRNKKFLDYIIEKNTKFFVNLSYRRQRDALRECF